MTFLNAPKCHPDLANVNSRETASEKQKQIFEKIPQIEKNFENLPVDAKEIFTQIKEKIFLLKAEKSEIPTAIFDMIEKVEKLEKPTIDPGTISRILA